MSAPELKFPFARELQEQHDAVRAAARWFQVDVERERASGCVSGREALAFLQMFREQLIRHFRFEETNGFEGGLGSSDADIQRWARELVGQHRALEQRLDVLISRLESGDDRALPVPLLVEWRTFFGALHRHDAEENALLLWIEQET